MDWAEAWGHVGGWLKQNGKGLVGLAGAVATGNLPAGIAAVASMVTEATGTDDPTKALARLKADPETLVKLEEIAQRNEADIRAHHRKLLELELADKQHEHHEQQETIRTGDTAGDEYVRRTRPKIARQSWAGTAIYVFTTELIQAFGHGQGADWSLAVVMLSPAAAYFGFRTWDKFSPNFGVAK
jgi:hypothetical protein